MKPEKLTEFTLGAEGKKKCEGEDGAADQKLQSYLFICCNTPVWYIFSKTWLSSQRDFEYFK